MKKTFLLILAIIIAALAVQARQPQTGYRGFLEWSNSVRSDTYATIDYNNHKQSWSQTTLNVGATTSHGYQIDSQWFVGAGLGVEYCIDYGSYMVPLFAEGRMDMQFGRFTPFADVRAGVNLGEGIGAYLSPSIGYRFNWGRKVGINLGVGLTLAGYKVECYEGWWDDAESFEMWYVGTKHRMRAYFSFRLGLDF